MWRSPASSAHLRHLLRRLLPSPSPHLIRPIPPLSIPSVRSLSSSPVSDLARSISGELIKLATGGGESNCLDLPRHLSLYFFDVRFTSPLLLEILNAFPASGRTAVDLYSWIVHSRSFTPSDESLSYLLHFLGHRKDFRSFLNLVSDFKSAFNPKSFAATVDCLVRAGRGTQVVRFFDAMEKNYDFPNDRRSLSTFVLSLANHEFAGHAERLVKNYADDIFPDEEIYNSLIRGWCNILKLDEARRLMGEIRRGGFEIGTPAYNSLLNCVFRLCRKKDPLRLQPEAEKVLEEIESFRLARDNGTFRVLISNLCKICKTEDAMKLFRTMGEWGCLSNLETYITLIMSLYQAARVSEGDQMIEWMRSAGFGDALDRKAYYGFVKILCGIERLVHAMKVPGYRLSHATI